MPSRMQSPQTHKRNSYCSCDFFVIFHQSIWHVYSERTSYITCRVHCKSTLKFLGASATECHLGMSCRSPRYGIHPFCIQSTFRFSFPPLLHSFPPDHSFCCTCWQFGPQRPKLLFRFQEDLTKCWTGSYTWPTFQTKTLPKNSAEKLNSQKVIYKNLRDTKRLKTEAPPQREQGCQLGC